MFSEICDTEAIVENKVNLGEDIKVDEVKFNIPPKDVESTAKRKYCASESNEHNKHTIEERKKVMIKKIKSNSLFKF